MKIQLSDLDYLVATHTGIHPKQTMPIATAEFNLELFRLARIGWFAELEKQRDAEYPNNGPPLETRNKGEE